MGSKRLLGQETGCFALRRSTSPHLHRRLSVSAYTHHIHEQLSERNARHMLSIQSSGALRLCEYSENMPIPSLAVPNRVRVGCSGRMGLVMPMDTFQVTHGALCAPADANRECAAGR